MNGTIDARVCGYKANYSSDWAFFYFFSSARVYIVIYFTRMCELRHWLLCKIMGWANRVWLLRALWVSGPVIVIGWRRRFLEFRLVDFFFPLYFFQQASWLKCLFCLTESGGSPCALTGGSSTGKNTNFVGNVIGASVVFCVFVCVSAFGHNCTLIAYTIHFGSGRLSTCPDITYVVHHSEWVLFSFFVVISILDFIYLLFLCSF